MELPALTTISAEKCKIAIFFGGITNEANISLDSARTFYDSVRKQISENNIYLIFIDKKTNFYLIKPKWIYSNHIVDFSFFFSKEKPLQINQDGDFFKNFLRKCHAFFPFVHGKYGEDGQLTNLLKSLGIRSVLGSSAESLHNSLNKNITYEILRKNNFNSPDHLKINYSKWKNEAYRKTIREEAILKRKRFIVKPNDGGSSDGVFLSSPAKLEKDLAKTNEFSSSILIEEYISGREFSIIVLEDDDHQPFPLIPTEIQFPQQEQGIYTRVKKYLPGSGVHHITPASFSIKVIKKIISQAKEIYRLFHFQDWVRLDGFVHGQSEKIIWSDFNGIPGFGQDSFIFQQSILFGINTGDISAYLLKKALAKENYQLQKKLVSKEKKKTIGVIGGGETSERQISRMSWFNVIEKLEYLNEYEIKYFFLDRKKNIWEVTKFITLKHTVEEIEAIIEKVEIYKNKIKRLNQQKITPIPISLDCLKIKKINFNDFKFLDFLFIALHGGIGENGFMQEKLEKLNLPFNGSPSAVAKICCDKKKTSDFLKSLRIKNFTPLRQIDFSANELKLSLKRKTNLKKYSDKIAFKKNDLENEGLLSNIKDFFENKLKNAEIKLHHKKWILKPRQDGCSTGIIVLSDFSYQLAVYFLHLFKKKKKIPYQAIFPGHDDFEKTIDLPFFTANDDVHFLLEEYVDAKEVIELTVGVLENLVEKKNQQNEMEVFLPSKTIAQDKVLSLDEKFNKGLGINLTPAPELDKKMLASIKNKIKQFCSKLGLRGYARIDLFYHYKKDELYLIEVNNLPGLTAATIIFTQALLTKKINLPPSDFLKRIVDLGLVK